MKRKIIQNYALIQIIGQGMYGTVYKASHLQTNEQFAVKVITILKFQQNPKLQECTVNEINILSRIENSTHIIKYIQMLKTPNNFYFVYQFCNGGTLEHRLKSENKLSERESLKIFRQLLEAFKILNGYNIMHRDLKPDNIFLHNGVLKLGDFGFCKTLGKANDMASTMLGSPIYMAPEVLKGEAYTSKADIWSLGVVLYEMLFGFCPFQSNSIAKLITVLADTELKIPTEITPLSTMAQNLLKKLLVKDQFRRIDWFQLLNFNISEEGVISEPAVNVIQQLRLTSSERSIDEYVRKQSDQSPSMATNPNELMFKKKNQLYSKSNTELARGQKGKGYEAPDYNMGSNSPQKGNYSEEVKMDSNPYSSPNLLKRMSSPDQLNSKRKYLLQQHLMCINAVKTAISFLRYGEVNGLLFALVLFRRIEERLKRICDSIVYSQVQNEDIVLAINSELKQIEKQTQQVIKQARNNNLDITQVDAPKQMLRLKYNNLDDITTKMWYEMVMFLNDNKANSKATQNEWDNTIEQYVR